MSNSPNNIGDLVRRVAQNSPESPAFLELDRAPLTYAWLAALIEEVGENLNSWGIGRGDRIAGVLSAGTHQATCFLGVSSFSTYAPLSSEWTAIEYGEYFEKLAPTAVIIETGLDTPARDLALARRIPIFDLTLDQSVPTGVFSLSGGVETECLHPGPAEANDIAVILSSSGTTSRPKLVPCTNNNLFANAETYGRMSNSIPDERFLILYSFIHGGGLKSNLIFLLGQGVAIISGFPFSVEGFFRQLDELQPTNMAGSHTIAHTISRHLYDYKDIVERARSYVRCILISVSSVDPEAIATLEKAFDAPVIECYAISEVGWISSNPLPPDIRKHGTVGTAFENDVAIMDGDGEFLPYGHEGEIVTRGPSVIKEYLDDPEATAEAFVDGWFRTGDVGRFDEDGYLSIVGRLKEMINQGGQKVAPVEIDRVLGKHPALADVATFPAPHASLGEIVGVAVVLKPGEQADEPELRRFCLENLAPYKVPRLIYYVDKIPRDANGKIPRLRLFEELGLQAAPEIPPPQTARRLNSTQAALAGLWASVLEVDAVGIDNDFFMLGGDSLQAATLFSEIASIFSVELSLETILHEASTVARMAEVIERERKGTPPGTTELPRVSSLVPISQHRTGQPIFAVPGIGGNAIGYAHLAQELGTEYLVYGFQSRGLDGSQGPVRQIDEIARLNVAELLATQPAGPYCILGSCFGAIVAYEIAQQLRTAGNEVALLAIIDAPGNILIGARGNGARYRMPSRFPILKFVADRFGLYFRQLKTLDGSGRKKFLKKKFGIVKESIAQRDLFRGDRSELHQVAVIESNFAAMQSYSPAQYGGPAVIFLSEERETVDTKDLRLKWLEMFSGTYRVIRVPGTDSGQTLKPPNVGTLAQGLAGAITISLNTK